MLPSQPRILGKRRARRHIIADLSANHVERLALRCGFTVDSVKHDYGIDMAMRVYDANGEAQGGEFILQSGKHSVTIRAPATRILDEDSIQAFAR